MTLAVVVSRADRASEHVGEALLDLADWTEATDDSRPDAAGGGTVHRADGVELRTFEERHLDVENAAAAFDDPDCLVFASRHAGETGPLLTAHHTGNFGPAEYGGADGRLARAAPNALREIRAAFAEHAPPEYEVGVEATHHGPSEVGVPALFAEVGSDDAQWDDPDAARAVARSILDLRGVPPHAPTEDGTRRHLVGFGGGHYAPRFDRILAETGWGVGHVAADWALAAMGDPRENRDVIERAFERSAASVALVKGDRPALRDVIESLGYRVVGETWVRETDEVPLGLAERLEDELVPVADGLRFGAPARRSPEDAGGDVVDADAAFDVASLPEALLAEATGVDRDAAREAVADEALAFVTEQNGAVVTGPAALPASSGREAVVDALAAVIEAKYDEVIRAGDEVVARVEGFDPDLAREAGVPEGPKFGKLSAGEAVRVGDRTVTPADVTTERERRFTF